MLPYGQMSLWGLPELAQNVYFNDHFNSAVIVLWGSGHPNKISEEESVIFPTNYVYLREKYPSKFTNKKFRVPTNNQIGPQNIDIISILFGSLLGNCHAGKRSKRNGTRFNFYQESSHETYLIWLHNYISELGYCYPKKPIIKKQLCSKGIVRKTIKFRTWTLSSFNWIRELWYIKKVKKVPSNIKDFLTPLALAIWVMEGGRKIDNQLRLETNTFSYPDCLILMQALYENFDIKSNISHIDHSKNYYLYIYTESMPLLRKFVKPHTHSSMKYKLK